MQVLIVEDMPMMAMVAKKIVSMEDHDVLVALTPDEARKIISESPIEAIFMDIGLSDEISGLALSRELRDNGYSGLVIGLTANRDAYTHEEYREVGFNACLQKPLELSNLSLLNLSQNETYFTYDLPDFDLDFAIGLMGDKNVAIELHDMFVKTMPEYIKNIGSALERKDISALSKLIYDIRGEVLYCGSPKIKATIESCLDTIKSDASSPCKLKAEIGGLLTALQDFIDAYPEFRRS